MTDSNLDHLDPILKPLAERFLVLANAQFKTKITVTYRSSADQDKAHLAGLSNAIAGQSPHNCVAPDGNPASKAFDFAIFTPDGKYITDGKDSRYADAGQIIRELGLDWGGTWHHPDYDHAEMKNWRNT